MTIGTGVTLLNLFSNCATGPRSEICVVVRMKQDTVSTTADAKFSMSNLSFYFRAFKPSFVPRVFSTYGEVLCVPFFFLREKNGGSNRQPGQRAWTRTFLLRKLFTSQERILKCWPSTQWILGEVRVLESACPLKMSVVMEYSLSPYLIQ